MPLHKKLASLKRAAKSLNERQLKSLDAFIHKLLANIEAQEAAAAGREVLEERQTPKGTYRLQKIRCGKEGCRCKRGELHGPYWYRFWSEGGRTRSEYIGKREP